MTMRIASSATATLLVAAGLLSGCSGMLEAYRRDVQGRVLAGGQYELSVDARLTDDGFSGVVMALGCVFNDGPGADGQPRGLPHGPEVLIQWLDRPSTVTMMAGDPTLPPGVRFAPPGSRVPAAPASEAEAEDAFMRSPDYVCDRFPVADAAVNVTVGEERVVVRTDASGRFAVDRAADLERLQRGGTSAHVVVTSGGRRSETEVAFGGLDEVAAMRRLAELGRPTTDALMAFLVSARGTPAHGEALARHGGDVCREFRGVWVQMMATGELRAAQEVAQRFGAPWRDAFCSTCEPECRVLDSAVDLSAELGMLGP